MRIGDVLPNICCFPDCFPDLTDPATLASLFQTAVAGAFLGAAGGACVALIAAEIAILPAVLTGGAIGLTVLVAIWFFRSMACEEDLRDLLDNSMPIGQEFAQIKARLVSIFNQATLEFQKPSQNYRLHNEITTWVNKLNHNGTQSKTFKVFLQAIHGRKAIYPDGRKVRLDFSREIRRLDGIKTQVKVERLDYTSDRLNKDLKEIAEIGEEGFGAPCEFNDAASFKLRFAQVDNRHVYVARDENNNDEIIGMFILEEKIVTVEGQPDLHEMVVATVARRANASKLQIGEQLFKRVMEDCDFNREKVTLHVRASNKHALALYEKIGFEETGREENYYPGDLSEDALIMTYNKEAARQAI